MICYQCKRAADEDRQDLHDKCTDCACQHHPVGDCIPVKLEPETAYPSGEEETE